MRFPSLPTILTRLRLHGGRLAVGGLIVLLAAAVATYYGGLTSLSPYYHWRQARAAEQRHDFPRAWEHLAVCLEDWPADPATHLAAARLVRRAGDEAQAAELLQAAQRLGAPREAVELEQELLHTQRGSLAVANRLHARLETAGRDDRFLIYEALAVAYLAQRKPEPGLAVTTRWVEEFPDAWQPLYVRSSFLELGTSYEAAAADVRRAVEMRPDLPHLRLALAHLERRRGAYRESLEAYRAVLRQQPDNVSVLAGIAHSLYNLGELDEARAAAARLRDAAPNSVDALILQARLDLEADRPDDALRWARAAEKRAPRRQEVVQALADSLRRLDRPEAREYLKRALEMARLQNRRDVKSVELFNLKEDASPEARARGVALRHEIASLYHQLGQDAEALTWAQSALQHDPQHRPSRDLLKDVEQALEQLKGSP